MASTFRADVQGIRALAVLLVVVFHAGGPAPGGFVGVDVFFVVSGFVIGGSLFAEAERSGAISLSNFYRRRVRRLLPALSLLIAVTLVATALLASPLGPQSAAANTGIAAMLFASNFYLATSGSGYFDVDQEANPLLHLWSLSVEEQFYFLLPALVALTWWAARRTTAISPRTLVAVLLTSGTVLSLYLSVALTSGNGFGVLGAPERMAFYSTPTRVWEFTAGVLLALAGRRAALHGRLAILSSIVGIALIGIATVTFDALTAFPGSAALLPVLGTVALIAADEPSGPIQRLLASPPAVWIGDRSYSWYLWHWPLIVFATLWWPSSPYAAPIAALVSLAPAIVSFELVEEPIRRHRMLENWGAPRMLATASIVPIIIGVGVQQGAQRNWGLEVPVGWGTEGIAADKGCRDNGSSWDDEACTFTVENPIGTIFLVGDSHAGAAADGVIKAGNGLGYDVSVWFRTSCPIHTRVPAELPDCAVWQNDAIDTITERSPDLVVVANRSTLYTLPDTPQGDHGRPIADVDGVATRNQAQALAEWSTGLSELTSAFTDAGSRVLVMAVVPEYDQDPRQTLSLVRSQPPVPEIGVLALAERRGPVLETEEALADSLDGVTVFDPAGALCGDGRCVPVAGDAWLYSDGHHLNPSGSRMLAPHWAAAVEDALTG